jgi:hypothetical protein
MVEGGRPHQLAAGSRHHGAAHVCLGIAERLGLGHASRPVAQSQRVLTVEYTFTLRNLPKVV